MSWTLDKHGSADNGSTASTTVAVTLTSVAAGDLLVCAVTFDDAGGPTLSVSDSVNGAWTSAGPLIDGTGTLAQVQQIFYFAGSAAGSPVITATSSLSNQFGAIVAAAFIPPATASLDQETGQHVIGGTNPTSGNVTTTANGDLIFAATVVSGANPTAGSSFTVLDSTANSLLTDEWQVQASSGSIAGTFTSATSQDYVAQVATFKAGGAVVVNPNLLPGNPAPSSFSPNSVSF